MTESRYLSWTQIRTLTSASLRARYRNTYAGMLWVVLSPLLMYAAQGFAFKYVLKIQFENYPLFLLTGLLPWTFLISSLVMATGQIVNQARLFKSFPIHPIASIASTVLDNFINFLFAFVLILVPVLLLGEKANLPLLLWLPVPLLSLVLATIGSAIFLATQQVFFHDTRFLVDFAAGVAFYVTPIFYPPEFISPQLRWIIAYNPIAILIQPFQSLSRTHLPADFALSIFWSYAVSLSIFLGALWFWRAKRNGVFFYL